MKEQSQKHARKQIKVGCYLKVTLVYVRLILSSHLRLGLPNALFPSGFPTNTLCGLSSPIHATCPSHLILLDLTTRTILGEEYKSFSSSLCNFLHSPLLNTLSL